jgi:putative FmdB family regulatory protein
MPTYDYQCDACDHKFELYQGINDEKKRKCPECGKRKLRRLIGTGAAIVFKGSGFYQTDYRSESYNKAKAADKPSDGGGGGSGDTKSGSSSAGESKSSGEAKSSSSSGSSGGETKSRGKKKSGGD